MHAQAQTQAQAQAQSQSQAQAQARGDLVTCMTIPAVMLFPDLHGADSLSIVFGFDMLPSSSTGLSLDLTPVVPPVFLFGTHS